MTDTEFNENTTKIIDIMQLGGAIRAATKSIHEYKAEWGELLEKTKSDKETFDHLFAIPPGELTTENNKAIAALRKKEYVFCLCDLGKYYMAMDRYYAAEEVLTEAAEIGSVGAAVLLFSLYAENTQQAQEKFVDSYIRVKGIDIWSEAVSDEVNNEIFLGNAILYLAMAYRVFDKALEKAYNTLTRILNSDVFDGHEQIKNHAREQLAHYHKGIFGGFRYVE